MRFPKLTLLSLSLLALAACMGDEVAEAPPPQVLTNDANGYFCGMVIVEHGGPKAQIHLIGEEKPVWFSAVRDMFGFLMLPGEARDVTAVYVTDMSKAKSWNQTNQGPWMNPKDAYFVINSSRTGGMGAIETVPFSIRADAEKFVTQYGGEVVTFDDVEPGHIFDDIALEN